MTDAWKSSGRTKSRLSCGCCSSGVEERLGSVSIVVSKDVVMESTPIELVGDNKVKRRDRAWGEVDVIDCLRSRSEQAFICWSIREEKDDDNDLTNAIGI